MIRPLRQRGLQSHGRVTIRLTLKFSWSAVGWGCAETLRHPISDSMKALLQIAFSALTLALATSGALRAAEDALPDPPVLSAEETALDDWIWQKRPVLVFADNPADPRFIEQMELIEERMDALVLRDVVVITDTDPAARTDIRRKLRPRGFMLVVLAKDGTIVIRKPAPWDVREISRSIDKLPLRQQEIRDRRDVLRREAAAQ
ncbi:DUF4174 domain-containing protein [Pacificoceanicola onchidii]|uniref:DUF4174 domain-containing protein n=1 Tax=Pacificoceanicola onchidii TaxID=2562685 RepID=UPI003B82DF6B